jgi:hypothetical protein
VRALLRRVAGRRFTVVAGAAGGAYGYARGGRPPGPDAPGTNGASRDYDFEGTAEEIDPEDPQLPR